MSETPRSFRAEAIVLRHINYGEADRILTLYTRDQGKMRVIAKGVRKIKSRKAGHLEPFNRITLQIARGHDLNIVTQAETLQAYPTIHNSLESIGYASILVELVDKLTFEAEENLAIFQLLTDGLNRLDQGEDPFLTILYFEIHYLEALGYKPELFCCANCRRPIEPVDQFFAPGPGGIICPHCAPGIPGSRPASMQALKYLRHLQRNRYTQIRLAHPDAAIRAEMEELIQYYYSYLFENHLNAPLFLRQILRPPE